jgi:ABC-type glycerol-3-phosphate transport system substrate-binding protein
MGRQIVRFPYRLLWPALLGWSLAGCSSDAPSVGIKSDGPTAAIELNLLVVDDPALAEVIKALRAEWKARTRGNLKINEISASDLIAAQMIEGTIDAIVYPSDQLGLLATRDWIAPLPAEYAKSQELAWSDLFELLQVAESTWGQAPYAVPFGSPVLTCYYRGDLFDRFKKRPPRTWSEYHELAKFFGNRENLANLSPAADTTWFGTIEPGAKGWASRVLLARAAAYAKHRDHFSTLFQIDTMQPLVGGPPFVRALDEMAKDAKLSAPNQLELDPAGVRREFLAGHAALAISWPSRVGASEDPTESKELIVGFAELPGSEQVYNFAGKVWENRNADESSRIPLLCVAGRLGSVTRGAVHPENALQLLAWLSGRQWGSKVSSASPATTLYRHSQIKTAQDWLEPKIDIQAARQYAHTVEASLGRQAYLFAPRIPGQKKYLAALDRAVEQVIRDQKSSADALQEAAETWKDITEALGHDAQRAAYRKSLGLDP